MEEVKSEDISQSTFIQECIGELIGMTFFVLVLGYANQTTGFNPFFSVGLYLVIILFANISGSHFNPCLSLAQYIYFGEDKFPLTKLITYVAMQLLGVACGWGISYGLNTSRIICPAIADLDRWYDAVLCEIIWGGFLAFVVLFVVSPNTQPSKNYMINCMMIALCLTFVIEVGGPISGGSFNPAIGLVGNFFGYLFVSENYLNSLAVSTLCPIVGCIVASVIFKYAYEPFYIRKKENKEY